MVNLLAAKNLEDYIFRLRNNLRNTPSIHSFAVKKSGLGVTAEPLETGGIDPVEMDFSTRKPALAYLESTVTSLLEEHHLTRGMITILSNINYEASMLADVNMLAGHRLEPDITTNSKGIRFRTVSQYKGLESDVVLLLLDYSVKPGKQHHNITNELIYVGCTRAKYLLYVVNILPEGKKS